MLGLCTFIILVILMFFFLFHLGVVVGFPLGNYTFNARNGRQIDFNHKIISGIYLFLCAYSFIIYGENGKLFKLDLNDTLVRVSLIISAIFFGLDFFWSFASRSKKEKLMKTPLLLLAFVCTVILLCL